MNLPLWYFVMHLILVTHGASAPVDVEASTMVFFFRNKIVCQKEMTNTKKWIDEADIELEPDKTKVVLGTKCRQATISDWGMQREHDGDGLRILDVPGSPIRPSLWGIT